jgi:enediyne biosynthesis protein E4
MAVSAEQASGTRWLTRGLVLAGSLACLLGGSQGAEPMANKPVRIQPLTIPATGKPGFTPINPAEAGLGSATRAADAGEVNLRLIANRGVALGDYDGDGWCDILLFLEGGDSALYRNRGSWQFEEESERSGLPLKGRNYYGGTFADVNGDGHLDVVLLALTRPQGNALFLNDGQGRFREAKDFPWLHDPTGGSITAALADIDGDGDVDLYVANYRQRMLADVMSRAEMRRGLEQEIARLRAGQPLDPDFARAFDVHKIWQGGPTEYYVEEVGVTGGLYLNDGRGGFQPADDLPGRFRDEDGQPLGLPADWSLCATFRDVNGDGAPDLYVCNDFFSPDRFWLNDGRGGFQLVPRTALRHTTRNSMGMDFADVNRDGHLDFVTVDMLKRNHTAQHIQAGTVRPPPLVWGEREDRPQYLLTGLFAARGDGTYADVGCYAGITATDWAWSAVFLDADLDGLDDLLVTTGVSRDAMDADIARRIEAMGDLGREARLKAEQLYPPAPTRNLLFRNLGGFRFEETGAAWGLTERAVSGGVALADLDNDGDLDVVINNAGSPPEIYRNDATAPRVAVRLRGRAPNTQAVGAQITLLGGAVPVQTQEVTVGGLYTSGSDTLRVFAAGANAQALRLEIRWRDGTRTTVNDVRADQLYVIQQP